MIKIADFARTPFSQSFVDENILSQALNDNDTKTQIPSSSKNVKLSVKKPRTRSQKSPRKPRFTLNGNFHKISDFFPIAKKEC